ncbi:MAG: transposase [Gemmatimonadetes bacterium]|nr:transposase [Gemmatimonadota bacterium]
MLTRVEEEGFRYVARLRSNRTLERLAAPHLKRPPGRLPAEGRLWTHEREYRAGSWSDARRVVLVVVERPGTSSRRVASGSRCPRWSRSLPSSAASAGPCPAPWTGRPAPTPSAASF